MSPRILLAAAPMSAAAILMLGAPCAPSAHPVFLYTGVVHADAECGSGVALGPGALQLLGIAALLLVTAAANSALVRDTVGSFVGRLRQQPLPVRIPAAQPVSSSYRGRFTYGAERRTSSRDPPSV